MPYENEHAILDTPLLANAPRGFGDWQTTLSGSNPIENYEVGRRYRASTDGFVSAISAGNAPANGVEIQWSSTGDTNDFHTRARGEGAYDGAVLPVRRGTYWRVKRHIPGGVQISIAWMPVYS
ncbi:MAG: hypothetical protein HXY21_14475 [Parvularculaceae bacterium]|nr:hypothetical protein [Parvularculaceae bacterium]